MTSRLLSSLLWKSMSRNISVSSMAIKNHEEHQELQGEMRFHKRAPGVTYGHLGPLMGCKGPLMSVTNSHQRPQGPT